MGTYYYYVNHTRMELVSVGLVCGNSQSVISCGGVLTYLMMPAPGQSSLAVGSASSSDMCQGRWSSEIHRTGQDVGPIDRRGTIERAQVVSVVADGVADEDDLGYVDITRLLIDELELRHHDATDLRGHLERTFGERPWAGDVPRAEVVAGRFTRLQYGTAIQRLRDAMTQLGPTSDCCAVCGDSGHLAYECGRNPLVAMSLCEQIAHDSEELHETLHRLAGHDFYMGVRLGPASVVVPADGTTEGDGE